MAKAIDGDATLAMPIRDIRFEFPPTIPSHWCAGQPEFSHIANAFMQALPYLEPYFIHNIREAAERITDPKLKEEVVAYVGQEARHAQEHRRFNQVLNRYYPGLSRLEAGIKARLDRSRKQDSLSYRMAYTAGYEAITYRMACFLLLKKDSWLATADPRVFGMLVWHMVEEVEHKNVAFDVFQAVDGRLLARWKGLYDSTVMTVRDISAMVRHMLEVDGLWDNRESERRLRRVVAGLVRELAPGFRHYLMPGHHPSKDTDPPLVSSWRASYARGQDLRTLSPCEADAKLSSESFA